MVSLPYSNTFGHTYTWLSDISFTSAKLKRIDKKTKQTKKCNKKRTTATRASLKAISNKYKIIIIIIIKIIIIIIIIKIKIIITITTKTQWKTINKNNSNKKQKQRLHEEPYFFHPFVSLN